MSGFYNDQDDATTTRKTIAGAVAAASLVFLVFLVLLYQTTRDRTPKSAEAAGAETVSEEEEDVEVGKSNIRSQDLDFWDMFRGEDEKKEQPSRDEETEGKPAVFTEQGPKPDRIEENKEEEEYTRWDEGNPNDSTHISVTDETGKQTWYELLDIPRNDWAHNSFKTVSGGMTQYDNGTLKSPLGADLSSLSGTVDIKSMKEAGLSFVMLRAIARNAQSGAVEQDPVFATLATEAKEAGLEIGVYVDSAATNENEAVEEANYAIASATGLEAKYPVVMALPDHKTGNNRMCSLSNADRTKIIRAFCDQVRSFGQKPMLRATRDDLISKVNLEDLAAIDIWVVDRGEASGDHPYVTDYPYAYTIWQYGGGTDPAGLKGEIGLDLSFIHYEQN